MSKETNPDFKIQIRKILDDLRSLGDDMSKVKEIVNVFIREAPAQLDAIDDHLTAEKFKEASKLIHKAKVRYGYFGLEDILADLDKWENFLKNDEKVNNHKVAIQHIKEQTNRAIEELKQSDLYNDVAVKDSALPLKGKLILVAEDDDINAMVFDLFIKEVGADTVLVTDGRQALAQALEKKPHLIFMDVHMPFFSGLDAIKALRNAGCTCPIISLSASTRLNERQTSIDAGANDFLVKPVNREAINRILFRYLS